jgi:cobalt/nickel transport protein
MMSRRFARFVLSGLLFAAALALLASPWADTDPDGLRTVARQEGFATSETRHALEDSPVAGYELSGVDDDRLSTGLAGLAGVLATFAITVCVLAVTRSAKDSAEGRKEPN